MLCATDQISKDLLQSEVSTQVDIEMSHIQYLHRWIFFKTFSLSDFLAFYGNIPE